MVRLEGLRGVDGLLIRAETRDALVSLDAFVRSTTHRASRIFVYPSSPLLYVITDRPNPRVSVICTPALPRRPGSTIYATPSCAVCACWWSPVDSLLFWGPPRVNHALETELAHSFGEVARFGGYRVLMRLDAAARAPRSRLAGER